MRIFRIIPKTLIMFTFSLLCTAETVTTPLQQYGLGSLECAAYSLNPDRPYIVTGGGGGAVIWDAETAQPIRILSAPGQFVRAVAVSPDGSKVLTGSSDNMVRLWDALTGVPIRTSSGHTGAIMSVAFSPDGEKVLTGGLDSTAKLWDILTGTEIHTFSGHMGYVYSVALSPDGTKVLTGSRDGTAKLWDASSGAEIHTFVGHTDYVRSVAFSPDGTKVLTGSQDQTAKLWNASSGEDVLTFQTNTVSVFVYSVAFSPDGTKVLTGGYHAKLWDASSGAEIRTFSGHSMSVMSVAFSPDGAKVLTASYDHTARIWEESSGAELLTFSGHTHGVLSVALSPDGTDALTGDWGGLARLWDIVSGAEIGTFGAHTGDNVNSVAFSPNEMKVLTIGVVGAKLWDVSSGTQIQTFGGNLSGAFSPDGTKVLTGSQDGAIRLWDTSSGSELLSFSGETDEVWSVAFSPDGTKALTASWDSTAKLWDASSGAHIRTFSGHEGIVWSVALSPDGTKVLTGSHDNTAKLWDATSGAEIRTFSGHTDPIHSVAFSPDGSKALTGSIDHTAKLWNVNSGTEHLSISGHTFSISSCAYSADGARILTGSGDGTARIWELNPPRAIVIAGGGDYTGNAIADQVDELGAYAYKTLKRRLYEPEDILYLSAFNPIDPEEPTKPFKDADGDGLNDVDAWATLENLETALTGEFAQGAGRLMIILLGHGYRTGEIMAYEINHEQALLSTTLDSWLDGLQTNYPVDVTLVVDCCYSGEFTSDCEGAPTGRKRIVIASTGPYTEAVFLPPPDLTSFMYAFLGSAYMGNSMGEAWRAGKSFFEEFPVANQVPEIVDDSTGTLNADREFFGATWAYGVQSTQDVNQFFPAFEDWTANTTVSPSDEVYLWTELLPGQDPNEVVAVIRPPAPEVIAGDPVTNLPHLYLEPSVGDPQVWEVTAENIFTDFGQYVVSFTARFDYERVSNPVFTRITVSEGLDPDTTPIRAVLAIGETSDTKLSDAFEAIGPYAYSVYLDRFQDDSGVHHPEWIEYHTPFLDSDRDAPSSSAALANAINGIATDARVYVHLIADSTTPGELQLTTAGETITAAALDALLDDLQTRQEATVVLIVDAPYSGSFLPVCKATGDQQRVVLTGGRSSDTALFLSGPIPSCFTHKFLGATYQGNHLKDGYRSGRDFFRTFLLDTIKPQLDDNGDGISNKYDGALAQTLFLGRRYAFAGDEASELPFVLSIYPEKTTVPLASPVSLTAQLIEGITPTRVFAQLVPAGVELTGEPISELDEIEFSRDAPDGWTWSGSFTSPSSGGTHMVAVYAAYPDSATEDKASNAVFAALGDPAGDSYEPDDTSSIASPFYIGGGAQAHTIHTATDEDWIDFYTIEALSYTITAGDPGTDLDLGLEIYAATNLVTPLVPVDDELAGVAESVNWNAPDHGQYFARVYNAGSGAPSDSGYTLNVVEDMALTNGTAVGVAENQMQVNWTPAVGRTVLGFSVQRAASLYGSYSEVASLSSSATGHLDGGLSPGTLYYYMIYEYDESWNQGQLTVPFFGTTLPGPPTPTPTETSTPTVTPTATPSPTPSPTATVNPNLIWVEFDYEGIEVGTYSAPYNTLAEGVAAVNPGGTVCIKASVSGEILEITKSVRIEAPEGQARIGVQ